MAFSLPKFALKMKFGKADRPSDSYDEVVRKYREKLAEGGKASGRFLPEPVGFGAREELTAKLDGSISKLCSQIEKYTEKDLDMLLLPHPLMGKLTLREMLCFTIYHAGHHLNNTRQNLA